MTVTVVSETEVRGKTGVRPRLYGHLLLLNDGHQVYLARRKHRERTTSARSASWETNRGLG